MSYDISVTASSGASSHKQRIRLTGELCVFHAAELKRALLKLLEPRSEREVDLSGVSEIDTAGVQLLLIAKREAAQRDCQLSFINHSEPLLEVVDLLNLSRSFGDPVLITASRQEDSYGSE